MIRVQGIGPWDPRDAKLRRFRAPSQNPTILSVCSAPSTPERKGWQKPLAPDVTPALAPFAPLARGQCERGRHVAVFGESLRLRKRLPVMQSRQSRAQSPSPCRRVWWVVEIARHAALPQVASPEPSCRRSVGELSRSWDMRHCHRLFLLTFCSNISGFPLAVWQLSLIEVL